MLFPAAAQSFNANNDNGPGFGVGSITFEGSGYVVSGNRMTVLVDIVANNTAGTNVFNPDIQMPSVSDLPVTVGAVGATLVLNGTISGDNRLIKDGSGVLQLGGASDYLGATKIDAGMLVVTADTALGSAAAGTFVAAGAALALEGNVNYTTPEAMTLSGGGLGNIGALSSVSGNNSFAGAVTLSSDTTVNALSGAALNLSGNIDNGGQLLKVNGAGKTTLNGNLSGSGGLTKTDAGILQLSGTADFLGATDLTAGNLLVSSSGTVTSSTITVDGGLLGGLGTVADIIANAGTVSPGGTDGAATGILKADDVTFQTGASFVADLNGTTAGSGFDQLQAAGAVDLGNSILDASLGFTAAVGDTFNLVTTTAASGLTGIFRARNSDGTFTNLPNGATAVVDQRAFQTNYSATSASLTRFQLSASTSLTANPPGSSTVGQNVAFSAVLAVGGIGQAVQPVGTYTFTANTTTVGANVPLTPVGSNFGASVQTNTLPAATYNVVALYQNDPNIQVHQGLIPYQVNGDSAANEQYVAQVYADLLLRPADAAGLDFWSGLLDSGTPRTAVADFLTHSDEYYTTNVIKPAYLQFLGRPADDAGLAFWVAQMQAGMTDQQVQAAFVGSAEFFANAGGTNPQWVDAMYDILLGRPPDQAGRDFWVGVLAAGASRAEVALGFTDSEERARLDIQATYLRYLGRPADQAGEDFWVNEFRRGRTIEDIVTGFIGSPEYFAGATG